MAKKLLPNQRLLKWKNKITGKVIKLVQTMPSKPGKRLLKPGERLKYANKKKTNKNV